MKKIQKRNETKQNRVEIQIYKRKENSKIFANKTSIQEIKKKKNTMKSAAFNNKCEHAKKKNFQSENEECTQRRSPEGSFKCFAVKEDKQLTMNARKTKTS